MWVYNPPWVSTGRVGYPQPGLKSGVGTLSGVVDPSNHHKTEWNWKGHSLSILAWVTSSQHSRIKQHGTALSGQAPLKNIPAANRIKPRCPTLLTMLALFDMCHLVCVRHVRLVLTKPQNLPGLSDIPGGDVVPWSQRKWNKELDKLDWLFWNRQAGKTWHEETNKKLQLFRKHTMQRTHNHWGQHPDHQVWTHQTKRHTQKPELQAGAPVPNFILHLQNNARPALRSKHLTSPAPRPPKNPKLPWILGQCVLGCNIKIKQGHWRHQQQERWPHQV